MRARAVLVAEIAAETPKEMSLVQDDHVVEKLAADRADHAPDRGAAANARAEAGGHFGYYGITGNFEALKHFREQVVRVWRKWLGRRSQRACMTCDRRRQLLERNPLPRARILRPYSPA